MAAVVSIGAARERFAHRVQARAERKAAAPWGRRSLCDQGAGAALLAQLYVREGGLLAGRRARRLVREFVAESASCSG